MKIEVPNINEYERINKIAKQVHELHVKWRPDIFVSIEEVITKEKFEAMIQAKEIYVAKIENKIVGYVSFNIKERANHGMRYRKQLEIDAIGVDEKYRGKGIGTALLNYMKEVANENDCTDIYLTVNEENEGAIRLYEKFGFKLKNIAYSMQLKDKGDF